MVADACAPESMWIGDSHGCRLCYQCWVKPRLFGIVATGSPIVAVLRRGPSDWSQVSRWDPEAGTFLPGSWTHANIYPQRCDLSPDGQWFAYFTLRNRVTWSAGPTYIAISRLPWLSALAAWGTCGTWTLGVHFVENPRVWEVGDPAEGDIEPLRRRYRLGLELTQPRAFAVERRHGWLESPDSQPYDAELDLWDATRGANLTMEKPRPGSGNTRLTVRGAYAAFRSGAPSGAQTAYALVDGDGVRRLEGVQWADWDHAGRLLVATTDAQLQVLDPADTGRPIWSIELAQVAPEPTEPPSEARRWVR
jgi:hypothetical protein